ncbi:MAG: hypothetical protein JSV32_03645, partial [Dehalococcoidia bacterium]
QSLSTSLGCPVDVSSDYVDYLYKSLVRRGYLKETTSRAYQLTVKGRLAIFALLRQNETRVQNLAEALQNLGIETGEWIGKI